MVMQNWKWWSPASMLGLLAGDGTSVLSSLAEVGEPRIGVLSDAFRRPLAFEASGLSPRELHRLKSADSKDVALEELFSVFLVDNPDKSASHSISGNYLIDGTRLTFIPNHPLQSGRSYRAVFQLQGPSPDDHSSFPAISIQCDVAVPDSSVSG